MSKSKKATAAAPETVATKAAVKLGARDGAVDPVLASLFASSAGLVKAPKPASRPAKTVSVAVPTTQEEGNSASADDGEDYDSGDSAANNKSENSEEGRPPTTATTEAAANRTRKRKRGNDQEDLEETYFKRLQREEDKENKQRQTEGNGDRDETSSDDGGISDSDASANEDTKVDPPIRHEVFEKKLNDQDKTNRTVFLGNVSTNAIRDTSAKRILIRHLKSALKTPADENKIGKLESIRFRSTAYTAQSGPKKATFAKKELMDTTTTSTNAYAVFTTELAAQHVANTMNGTVVLDRHLRVDYLAKPLPVDHRRCVFVGNLSFVNEETAQPPSEGQPPRRPTAKQPADTEEGLWRTFSKCGAVESVRVVRDQETRVSKGFAYVQFQNENSVEAALLLNEKKFPPMLPRKLRVMRAKKTKVKPSKFPVRKTGPRSGAKPSKSSMARGRVGKPVVFEGHRATEGTTRNGKPRTLNDRRDREKKRPDSKRAQRGANFKRMQKGPRGAGHGKS